MAKSRERRKRQRAAATIERLDAEAEKLRQGFIDGALSLIKPSATIEVEIEVEPVDALSWLLKNEPRFELIQTCPWQVYALLRKATKGYYNVKEAARVGKLPEIWSAAIELAAAGAVDVEGEEVQS